MSEYQENSTVLSIERLADALYRLTLSAPLIAAAARPGQFVMAACGPLLDPLLRRPISLNRCLDQTRSNSSFGLSVGVPNCLPGSGLESR
jgi:NAD(P)H-flavin reductase